ncbi:jg27414 [Pararge aegeria aegeria]|uniref:Jg27414 protein n=1 Tax=Pararge aegeria aegeria TaxID=348720 RepID=A0A8S4R7T2_9NEOP|nr:jg27414 [Pararge aegeria aegeria]
MYADDLQLYYHFEAENLDDAVRFVNADLGRIGAWSDRNSLVLNPLKSKYILFGSAKQLYKLRSDVSIDIEGCAIERVYKARNLRFEEHLAEVVRNCFYRLKILYKVRQYLSVEVRLQLVEALVLSKLSYADVVFGPRLLCRTKRLI